jgi:hypothetical protein
MDIVLSYVLKQGQQFQILELEAQKTIHRNTWEIPQVDIFNRTLLHLEEFEGQAEERKELIDSLDMRLKRIGLSTTFVPPLNRYALVYAPNFSKKPVTYDFSVALPVFREFSRNVGFKPRQ